MRVIALSGPKHCGKSAVGRALGEKLRCRCFDLDTEIERRSGRSPRELFKEGADVFRKAEAETLGRLLQDRCGTPGGIILALGGGIIDNPAALTLLNNGALTMVYLEVSAETAWKRIEAAAKTEGELPPFLQGAAPKTRHRDLHERRAAAYRARADLIINAENKSVETIAGELCVDYACE
jgi:shikimate kinase